MLNEHLRELKYDALLAGMKFDQYSDDSGFGFNLSCYNQNYFEFFAEAFREIKNFCPTESFFASKRN